MPADQYQILLDAKDRIQMSLSNQWHAVVQGNALHVFLLSLQDNISVQRSVLLSPDGSVNIFVHCSLIEHMEAFVKGLDPPEPIDRESVDKFVDRAVTIINRLKAMEVCSGYDDERFRAGWSTCPFRTVDTNPYQECRYAETFRSKACLRLVQGKKWRCFECNKMYAPLKRRTEAAERENVNRFTSNVYLTEKEKLFKLEVQQKKLEAEKKCNARLRSRVQEVIKKQAVTIDETLSNDLMDCLKNANLSATQSLFFQQQVKASQCKTPSGMRWHPTMVRLALSIYLTSPAAYELMRDSGMVKLPHNRTLFDYGRVKPVVEGVDPVVLDSLAKKVEKFDKPYKKYHVLMADEIYISQNLVFQKSTGRLIGYTSLDDVDKEVQKFEHYLCNESGEVQETMASKVMTYMIKGVSSGIKEVVASFAVGNLSANHMYFWTWGVIAALERTGIAILAFVSNGCSVNRAFIQKHKPITITKSGVIFDTINKAAPHRPLYFFSDGPHLLKTIRNNFLNSRWDGKKSRRHLVCAGKRISWDFLVKLYECKKYKILRKSYKLSPVNIYPDCYARMKVKYAAQVLSRTVAQDLEDQGWPQASETISFIRWVNDWFDCINGAHSEHGKKTRNKNLDSYKSPDDGRFEFMMSFLKYLDNWKQDAENPISNISTATDMSDCGVLPESDSIDKDDELEEGNEGGTPSSKRVLSYQTLIGIERTTRALIGAVKFLLEEGTEYINARVFTQDPLEQHFSKVRAGQGGSSNPNLQQVLNRNRTLHTIGELGMKRRRGNTQDIGAHVEVTTEPLPKRKYKRNLKFLD